MSSKAYVNKEVTMRLLMFQSCRQPCLQLYKNGCGHSDRAVITNSISYIQKTTPLSSSTTSLGTILTTYNVPFCHSTMQDFTKRDMAQFKSYVAELDPNFDLDISGWGEGQSKHVHDIHRNSTGGYIDARTMLRSDTIYSIVFFNKHSQTPHIYAELSSHSEPSNARIVEDL